MTLKLVSKSLPNKYAEQLYKNELNYNNDIDKLNNRIKLDYIRNSQYIDISSHVFLNQIKQKRTQWKKDDVKFREYYKSICRNTYQKYLENNKLEKGRIMSNLPIIPTRSQSNSSSGINKFSTYTTLPPINKPKSAEINVYTLQENMTVVEDKPFSYGKYSDCDREFLDKLPEKIELTNTDVGRRYLHNKREQASMIHRHKKHFSSVQTNAINDKRFKNLVSSLDV